MSTIENYTERIAEGAKLAFNRAEEMQAHSVGYYLISEEPKFADHFIVLNVDSPRLMRAVSEDIKKNLKTFNLTLHHDEGDRNSGWVLLDYGDLVIHIFAEEFREFYSIDSLLEEKGTLVKFIP
ncbi:MAG: ribosome silencing factor [Dehalococcoidia bacterium]|jgi:ribosome-associated protein|tara:strand:+ start:337 stop:708 length:372 start_codon:yes stop_codon:yes gene_type:complete